MNIETTSQQCVCSVRVTIYRLRRRDIYSVAYEKYVRLELDIFIQPLDKPIFAKNHTLFPR